MRLAVGNSINKSDAFYVFLCRSLSHSWKFRIAVSGRDRAAVGRIPGRGWVCSSMVHPAIYNGNSHHRRFHHLFFQSSLRPKRYCEMGEISLSSDSPAGAAGILL